MGLELFTQDQAQGRQVTGATFAKQAGRLASFEYGSGEVFSLTDNQGVKMETDGKYDIAGALSILVHTAYHLGGIRQALGAFRAGVTV